MKHMPLKLNNYKVRFEDCVIKAWFYNQELKNLKPKFQIMKVKYLSWRMKF